MNVTISPEATDQNVKYNHEKMVRNIIDLYLKQYSKLHLQIFGLFTFRALETSSMFRPSLFLVNAADNLIYCIPNLFRP